MLDPCSWEWLRTWATSQHVSTFGVLFPPVPALTSLLGALCLWKAQHDILRDLHLLCAKRHRLGGSRKAKASLEHRPGLPTRREDYFWIEALAHCHIWQNSHWSQGSQGFTSVAAILTPCPFCLGTFSQHNKCQQLLRYEPQAEVMKPFI